MRTCDSRERPVHATWETFGGSGTRIAASHRPTIGCMLKPTFTRTRESQGSQMTTAGRLLNDLHRDSAALRDAVVHAAGITVERADAAMVGTSRLTLAEQLRLSEATVL